MEMILPTIPNCLNTPNYIEEFPDEIEKLEEYLKDSYTYKSHSTVEWVNIDWNKLTGKEKYEILEDLEFFWDYNSILYSDCDPEDEECNEKELVEIERELNNDMEEIKRFLKELKERKIPHVIYENSNFDFYVIRILVIRIKEGD